VLTSLFLMRVERRRRAAREQTWDDLKQGFFYVRVIRTFALVLFLSAPVPVSELLSCPYAGLCAGHPASGSGRSGLYHQRLRRAPFPALPSFPSCQSAFAADPYNHAVILE